MGSPTACGPIKSQTSRFIRSPQKAFAVRPRSDHNVMKYMAVSRLCSSPTSQSFAVPGNPCFTGTSQSLRSVVAVPPIPPLGATRAPLGPRARLEVFHGRKLSRKAREAGARERPEIPRPTNPPSRRLFLRGFRIGVSDDFARVRVHDGRGRGLQAAQTSGGGGACGTLWPIVYIINGRREPPLLIALIRIARPALRRSCPQPASTTRPKSRTSDSLSRVLAVTFAAYSIDMAAFACRSAQASRR